MAALEAEKWLAENEDEVPNGVEGINEVKQKIRINNTSKYGDPLGSHIIDLIPQFILHVHRMTAELRDLELVSQTVVDQNCNQGQYYAFAGQTTFHQVSWV